MAGPLRDSSPTPGPTIFLNSVGDVPCPVKKIRTQSGNEKLPYDVDNLWARPFSMLWRHLCPQQWARKTPETIPEYFARSTRLASLPRRRSPNHLTQPNRLNIEKGRPCCAPGPYSLQTAFRIILTGHGTAQTHVPFTLRAPAPARVAINTYWCPHYFG